MRGALLILSVICFLLPSCGVKNEEVTNSSKKESVPVISQPAAPQKVETIQQTIPVKAVEVSLNGSLPLREQIAEIDTKRKIIIKKMSEITAKIQGLKIDKSTTLENKKKLLLERKKLLRKRDDLAAQYKQLNIKRTTVLTELKRKITK